MGQKKSHTVAQSKCLQHVWPSIFSSLHVGVGLSLLATLLPSALTISIICGRSVWIQRSGEHEIFRASWDGFGKFAAGLGTFLAFFHVILAALGLEPMVFDGPADQGRKGKRRRRTEGQGRSEVMRESRKGNRRERENEQRRRRTQRGNKEEAEKKDIG